MLLKWVNCYYIFYFLVQKYMEKIVDFGLLPFRVSISWFPSDSSFLSDSLVYGSWLKLEAVRGESNIDPLHPLSAAK